MATTERQKPVAPLVRYVTVLDAIDRLNVTERTVRRWIEKGRLTSIKDPSGQVRIDLADIEQILQDRPTTVPSLHEQVTDLLTRIEEIEDQQQEQSAQIAALRQQLEQGGGQRHRVHAPATQSILEKRGLPAKTERLVAFVKQHQLDGTILSIYDLKKLYREGIIELTVHHREIGTQRNKQEWWITPAQHLRLITYFQHQAIPYVACSDCENSGETTIVEAQEYKQ